MSAQLDGLCQAEEDADWAASAARLSTLSFQTSAEKGTLLSEISSTVYHFVTKALQDR